MRRRVVVTGMGIISPLGIGVEENWSAIINGKSGIGPITRFDTESFPVRFAGEVAGFDAEQYMGHKEVKKMDRFIHFAVAASDYALKDSGYKITEKNAERVGVQVGVGLGGLPAIEKYHNIYKEREFVRSPLFLYLWLLLTLHQAKYQFIQERKVLILVLSLLVLRGLILLGMQLV